MTQQFQVASHEDVDALLSAAPDVRARDDGSVWVRVEDGVHTLHVPDDLAPQVAALVPQLAALRQQRASDMLSAAVRAQFSRRIALVLGDKRTSLMSYAIKLNGLVSIGLAAGASIAQSLTAEQQADVSLIWAIDDWESAMIEAREALIAAADASYADDAHWPAPPAGVTPVWLAGF